tara:strand:- start:237 stop:455 length:219 start_codon:yes stop_codon:yes gene_type:complete
MKKIFSKKTKYWTQKTTILKKKSFEILTMKKKSFVIRDAVSNGIRFGLVEPITYESQVKKFMRSVIKEVENA